MATLFAGAPASLRTTRLGTLPPVNIGSTDDSVEIVAFALGLDPTQIDVLIDKGLLTINGKRRRPDPEMTDDIYVCADERPIGASRRVTELPWSVGPDEVNAWYVDGCLTISIGKSEASKPRQVAVQG